MTTHPPSTRSGPPRRYKCRFCAMTFRRSRLRGEHYREGAVDAENRDASGQWLGCATTRAEAARAKGQP